MYGWGKGAASHTTLVVSLLGWGSVGKAQSAAGDYPVEYLFLIVPWCPLIYIGFTSVNPAALFTPQRESEPVWNQSL